MNLLPPVGRLRQGKKNSGKSLIFCSSPPPPFCFSSSPAFFLSFPPLSFPPLSFRPLRPLFSFHTLLVSYHPSSPSPIIHPPPLISSTLPPFISSTPPPFILSTPPPLLLGSVQSAPFLSCSLPRPPSILVNLISSPFSQHHRESTPSSRRFFGLESSRFHSRSYALCRR